MIINDNDIVESLKNNPNCGFRMLMSKYKEKIYWHIRRLVVSHTEAEDAMQETFVRVFHSIHRLKDANSFVPWIYRIATNEALRILEHHKDEYISLDKDNYSVQNIAADNYIDYNEQLLIRFQKAILLLPPKQQLAFNLRYYDELSYDQIGEITNSTSANAKANYHFAKEKIIQYMNSHD